MLAYALFKQAIREDAGNGVQSPGHTRNPSPTVVQAYRQSAERRLEVVISDTIENATPEIQQSAVLNAVETAEARVSEHITRRTGVATALTVNIVAWAITLAITVLILSVAGRPDPGQTLADIARGLGHPPISSRPAPPTAISPSPADRALPSNGLTNSN